MTKKEKKLYLVYGREWDVIVKYKIVIASLDTLNIIKCNEKMCDLNCVMLKRVTRKIKLFKLNIYLNTLYGGIERWNL